MGGVMIIIIIIITLIYKAPFKGPKDALHIVRQTKQIIQEQKIITAMTAGDDRINLIGLGEQVSFQCSKMQRCRSLPGESSKGWGLPH